MELEVSIAWVCMHLKPPPGASCTQRGARVSSPERWSSGGTWLRVKSFFLSKAVRVPSIHPCWVSRRSPASNGKCVFAQLAWPLPSLGAEWFIDFFGPLAPTYSAIMTLPPQL